MLEVVSEIIMKIDIRTVKFPFASFVVVRSTADATDTSVGSSSESVIMSS